MQTNLPGTELHRVLDTRTVARVSGLKPRQIQYLDEIGAIIVTKTRRHDGALQRCFDLSEALVCSVIWELRDLKLKRREIRAVLAGIRHHCRDMVEHHVRQPGVSMYLITDGERVIASSENKMARNCWELRRRVVTVNLTEKLASLIESIE